MLYSVGNDDAPLGWFAIKNEPDEVEESYVTQDQGIIANSPSSYSCAEDASTMYNTNVKEEIITKTESMEDNGYANAVNEQMKTSITSHTTTVGEGSVMCSKCVNSTYASHSDNGGQNSKAVM